MNWQTRLFLLLLLILVILGASGCFLKDPGPTAEVTYHNGMWNTVIEDYIFYMGDSLAEAITAAIENLGPGTINIRDSGQLNQRIYPKTSQTLDFHNNPIGGNQSIHVYHQNNVTIRNLHMNGTPLHSLQFNGSSNIHLHNIWLQFSGNSGGIRIDNDRYEKEVYTSNVKVTGKILIEGTRGHGFETYDIDGLTAEQIVTRNTAGCGVLLNETKNAHIKLVDAYRADRTGGYAGFRVANNGGPNIVVDKVIAHECGRGVFVLSGSSGVEIHEVDINRTHNEGIFINGAQNVSINGGTVTDYSKYGVRLIEGSHTNDKVNNVTIQNLRVFAGSSTRQAVGIEESRGTSNNKFLNNDLRGAGRNKDYDLLLRSGSGSIAQGNILSD